MSRRSANAEEEAGAIDLTPMLDVVFIMLIFFIVTATFIKEPGIEVNRPDATTAISDKSNILVAINAKNEIWINKAKYDERQVKKQLQLLQAENPKSGVVIQADGGSNIKAITQVTQAAREIGIDRIAIAAEEG